MPPHLAIARIVASAIAFAACQGFSLAAAGAEATAISRCHDRRLVSDERIAACTQAIGDATLSAEVRSDAYVSRGTVHDNDEDHDEAIADFTEALKLSPDDPATLILRGNAHDAKGDDQRAIADYTEAIRLNPEDAAPYYNRGAVYQELGEREKAIADYRKALEIYPSYGAAKRGLAELTEP